MDKSNATAHGEELPQLLLEAVHKLVHAGASHQTISSALGLKLEVVQQVLAKTPSQITQLVETRCEQPNRLRTSPVMAADGSYYNQSHPEPHLHESHERVTLNTKKKTKISEVCRDSYYTQNLQAAQLETLPTFIYSYKQRTDQLHRTSLVTGEQSVHRVPSYQFNPGCCWSEVPGGSLLITGGGSPEVKEVVRIDTRRDFAVSQCPPMLTSRRWHATVYHTQHLYVLGGDSDSDSKDLGECEWYVCAENRWETLPSLPRACSSASGVVVERSLYALGGYCKRDSCFIDLVQKLSLEWFTWELMQLKLPYATQGIPYFKLRDTEVHLVVNMTLCSFTVLQVRPLKTLPKNISSWCGASYYHRSTLYCSSYVGAVRSYEIGSLSN
jgi:hypothetical protein